jgi:hypothetical protein
MKTLGTEPSYMALKKELYGRQPNYFTLCFNTKDGIFLRVDVFCTLLFTRKIVKKSP